MRKILTSKQKLALRALAHNGATHSEAARQAGVTASTVSRWLNHDELFMKQYEYECKQSYLSAQLRSRSKAGEVVAKLGQLMTCGNERVELSAAKEILDFAEGKALEDDSKTCDKEFTVNVVIRE